MPVSQVGCWVALGLTHAREVHWWVFASSLFYWLWAIKNRVVGPLWTDLAVFTFLPNLIGSGWEVAQGHIFMWTSGVCAFGCGLICVQYIGFLKLFSFSKAVMEKAAVDKMGKSAFWADVMWYYCIGNIAYWGISCALVIFHIVK